MPLVTDWQWLNIITKYKIFIFIIFCFIQFDDYWRSHPNHWTTIIEHLREIISNSTIKKKNPILIDRPYICSATVGHDICWSNWRERLTLGYWPDQGPYFEICWNIWWSRIEDKRKRWRTRNDLNKAALNYDRLYTITECIVALLQQCIVVIGPLTNSCFYCVAA